MTAKTILCCDICECSIPLASTGITFDTPDKKEIHICRPCQHDLLASMILKPDQPPSQTILALQTYHQPSLLLREPVKA